MIKLSPEQPEEGWEVETLYDLCFAPGREGLSSYRLRDGVAPAEGLSHVARDEFGELAGAIRYWPVRIGPARALLLGPVAVHPTRQGEGVGGLLIRESLAAASAGGWARVMLVGDAPYYARFGFTPLYTSFEDIWQAVTTLVDVVASELYKAPRFNLALKVT